MKYNLYVVTLEKIEQRYTKQWYDYFKKEFSKFFNVKYIDGELVEQKIKKGAFLDFNNTNIYKAQQVEKIGKLFNKGKIKNNDIFFFADGWHFGITATKYMAQLNNIKVRLYAFFHAGSWDDFDRITQVGMREWVCLNEAGWFRALDGSFVATHFHKKLICDYFKQYVRPKKIHVVGFPMDWNKVIKRELGKLPVKIRSMKKKNIVVFPHRMNDEKQPKLFDILAKRFPKWKFIKTLKVSRNKKEYYEILANAKIIFSSSVQETFGIGTVEGLMLGAIPLVPNRLSYVELYKPVFRYKNMKDLEFKMNKIMIDEDYFDGCVKEMESDRSSIIKHSSESIFKMSKVMLHGMGRPKKFK